MDAGSAGAQRAIHRQWGGRRFGQAVLTLVISGGAKPQRQQPECRGTTVALIGLEVFDRPPAE